MSHAALSAIVARAQQAVADGQYARTMPGDGWLQLEPDAFEAARLTLLNVRHCPGGRLVKPAEQAALLRDIFGNPFRRVAFSPEWRTDTVLSLAAQMYDARDFGAMPILADALQDAGCDNADVLDHCRHATAPHVRGCWVADLALGRDPGGGVGPARGRGRTRAGRRKSRGRRGARASMPTTARAASARGSLAGW